MLRLLHLGDLHLESPFAMFPVQEAAKRRARQYEALEALLNAAVQRGAQLVVMAGDVFDTPTPHAAAVAEFYRILQALPVPVVIAPGNHDHYIEGGVWEDPQRPRNVAVFNKPWLAMLDFPQLGATVYGYAFVRESADCPDLGKGEALREDRVNIFLAHADLSSPLSVYAPISAAQLERSGYSYAALGHIHKAMPAKRYGNTTAAYSGFFAGRGFDELGAGGARFVEIEGGTVREIVLKSNADTFERIVLDCTGAEGAEDLRRVIVSFLESASFPDATALRLVLEGDVALGCHVDTAQLERLGAHYALFEVQDRTLPLYDSSYLEKAPTVQGAFYRALLPRLQSVDREERELAAKALRLGLSALAGREV